MLRWTSGGAFGVLAGGLLAACGDSPEDDAEGSPGTTGEPGSPRTFSIAELASTPGPAFTDAPSAIAEELGFYREEGVERSVEYPGNSIRGIQTLVGGSGDITAADSFALLVGSAEGLDLRSTFLSARGYAFGFAVNASSPIREWSADSVAGSRIGITDFSGGEVPVLRGALAKLGITEGGEGGAELVAIGAGGAETADAIESGSVDFVAASILDFAIFRASGVELRVVTPDYIQEFPGHGYVTTPALLESNRDGFVGLLRAKAKGTVFLHANPLAAAEIAMAAAPASAEGMDAAFVADLLQSLYADGNAFAFEEGNPGFHQIGLQDPAGFDEYQRFLIETGSEGDDGTTLTAEVDVASIIDNSLIEEINDFDYAEVQALAADA